MDTWTDGRLSAGQDHLGHTGFAPPVLVLTPSSVSRGPGPSAHTTWAQPAPTKCQEPGCVQRNTENRMDVVLKTPDSPVPPAPAPRQRTVPKGKCPQGWKGISALPRLLLYMSPQVYEQAAGLRPARGLWGQGSADTCFCHSPQRAGHTQSPPASALPAWRCTAGENGGGMAVLRTTQPGPGRQPSLPSASTSGLLLLWGPGDMSRARELCTDARDLSSFTLSLNHKGVTRSLWKSQQGSPPRPALEARPDGQHTGPCSVVSQSSCTRAQWAAPQVVQQQRTRTALG